MDVSITSATGALKEILKTVMHLIEEYFFINMKNALIHFVVGFCFCVSGTIICSAPVWVGSG